MVDSRFHDNLGHALRAPDSLLDAASAWCFAPAGGRPPGNLAEVSVQLRSTPSQRQANGPASSGFGYRRPAATASPLSICGVPPMGACRAALLSAVLQIVRSFLPTSLAIPPEVLPSAAGPACRVHKKGRTACLPPFLQSFGIHSRHPRASHLPGERVDANGG